MSQYVPKEKLDNNNCFYVLPILAPLCKNMLIEGTKILNVIIIKSICIGKAATNIATLSKYIIGNSNVIEGANKSNTAIYCYFKLKDFFFINNIIKTPTMLKRSGQKKR